MDLSPVPEPAGMGLVARVRNPGHLLASGFGWLGLAIPPEQLIPAFGKKPVPFDLGAALDLIATVDGTNASRMHNAASLPIRSIEEMKDALGHAVTWRPLPNGAFAMEVPDDSTIPGAREAFSGLECAIAPSLGDAKARFVCADDEMLESLLPYLTRTLPLTPFDHDIAVEVRPNLTGLLARERRSWVSRSPSRAFASAAPSLPLLDGLSTEASDFASDVHGATISMDVDERGARLEMHLATKKASALSQILLTPASGPPDAFFDLPPDVDFTLFGAGTPRPALDGMRARGAPWLTRMFEDLSKENAAAMTDAAFDLASAPWVAAVSMGGPENAQGANTKKVWFAFAVQSPLEHVAELARRFVPPKSSKARLPGAGTTTLREVAMPPGFSRGAIALSMTYSFDAPRAAIDRGAPKSLNAVLHVLIASKGPFTWLVASLEEKVAIDLLQRATADDPTPTFRERADAPWFRGRALVSGADLALRSTLDPAILTALLGPAAKSVTLPPLAPLLVSTEVTLGAAKNGEDDLAIRLDAPASISVGFFFALFKDAITAQTAHP